MDVRERRLFKDTFILFIGNISTKLISFLLVPLYSFYLLPEDYGTYDLYLTFLSMLYVIVSLQAVESSFRFIQDSQNKEQQKKTVTNAAIIAGVGCLLLGAVFLFITYLHRPFLYCKEFYLYTVMSIFANLFLQTLRGMKSTVRYVIISVVSGLASALINIILITKLSWGGYSILVTPILVNFSVIIMCLFWGRFYAFLDIRYLSLKELRRQIEFSLPLVPNAICIWLLGALGRYILLFYYTKEDVGLLAFTLKFPQLLSTVSSIFIMAWQVNLIQSYGDKDRDSFSSRIFNQYFQIMLSLIVVILPLLKVVIFTCLGKDYRMTWEFIPIFFFGVTIASFAQFFNLGFYGAKKTRKVFINSIIAIVVYGVLGGILAKKYYIYGIGAAYGISELCRWLYIKRNIKEYLKVAVNWNIVKKFIPLYSVTLLLYYYLSWQMQLVIAPIVIAVVAYINRNLLGELLKIVAGREEKDGRKN